MAAVVAILLILIIVRAAFGEEAAYRETSALSYIVLSPSNIEIELCQSEKLFVKFM